jgi:hypothetical protein
VALVAAGLLWPRGDKGPVPAAKPVEVSNLHVNHHREGKDGLVLLGDLQTSTAAVRVKDGVELAADFSAPAHYYLIAFNPADSPDGVEQLCSPEGADGKGAVTVKPEQRPDLHYPRDGALFWVDAAGLQVFVLAASSKPLPPYDQWRKDVRDIPWAGDTEPGKYAWHDDGRELVRLPKRRGDVVGAPKALVQLRDWFKARPEFEAVQVFAFPVTADRD